MKYLLICILATLISTSKAQPIQSATADELVEKLAQPFSNTRSLTARNLIPQAKIVDLLIQFEFDSSRLKPDSKPILDALVSALKNDKLKDTPFLIEGHTDAKGTKEYNQTLSVRRANSVVEYLTQQGIEEDRLNALGKGCSELYKTDQPYAMENRRVRIISQPK